MKIENVISSTINARLPIVARRIHAPLIASLFILGMILLPWGATHAASTITPIKSSEDGIKWHPGHYYTILSSGKNKAHYLEQVYSELKDTPALRGVTIRYVWKELEPREGVYDFSHIHDRLAELAAQKKRLIVLLQTKSYLPRTELAPDYLLRSKYDGGVFPFKNFYTNKHNGDSIKFWNTEVYNRLAALVRALGKEFNDHPYFEGVGLTETAMGQPMDPISSTKVALYYDNLLNVNQQLRKHFPNTMTFQFTNYPRSILESFVGNLKAMGTGLGVPDVWLEDEGMVRNDPNTPQGVYHYFPELSGHVPLTPQVEHSNYVSTRSRGTGFEPTVPQLLYYARTHLKANYIFWTRTRDHYPEVLQVLNWDNQTGDPAGGLDTTCPKAFPSCIKW